jgi:hypothetical protein
MILSGAARIYGAQGWPVFPCEPGAKTPLTLHGFKNASTDPDTIASWWQRWPDANIGIPTGATTFDVLDVDRKADGTGFAALGRLARSGLVTGAHRLVKTPSGGLHLYFRPNGNGNGSSRTHHLDVRGAGGYVIAPPSIVNGVRYTIDDDRPNADGTLDWAACLRLLDPPRIYVPTPLGVGASIDALAGWLSKQSSVEGGRNHQLYWAACRAVADHAATPADLAPLIDAAVSIGLTESEATGTAMSAYHRLAGAA